MRTSAFSSFSIAKPLKYETKTDKQVSASSGRHIVEYPEEYLNSALAYPSSLRGSAHCAISICIINRGSYTSGHFI